MYTSTRTRTAVLYYDTCTAIPGPRHTGTVVWYYIVLRTVLVSTAVGQSCLMRAVAGTWHHQPMHQAQQLSALTKRISQSCHSSGFARGSARRGTALTQGSSGESVGRKLSHDNASPALITLARAAPCPEPQRCRSGWHPHLGRPPSSTQQVPPGRHLQKRA